MLTTDKFCPSCAHPTGVQIEGRDVPPWATPVSQPRPQTSIGPRPKSPAAAATLNFLLPGIGYVYTGLGRDTGEAIFGALVFIFFFIGFEVSLVAELLTYTPPTSSTSASPYDALIFLVFLLPFAFAYDGYRRAKQT